MTIGIAILGTFVKKFHIISGTHKLFLILFGIRNMLEIVSDIAQSTHGIRNIFADIRNVPTRPHMVLGMFLLPFPVLISTKTNICHMISIMLHIQQLRFRNTRWHQLKFFPSWVPHFANCTNKARMLDFWIPAFLLQWMMHSAYTTEWTLCWCTSPRGIVRATWEIISLILSKPAVNKS